MRNGIILLRLFLSDSNSSTASGIRNGSSPCAYSTNAAPILCVTSADIAPSSPSHTNPSVNWWIANSVGSEANNNSRLCFTCVSVATPIVPSTPLPTKLAAAEKHTFPSPGSGSADNTRLCRGTMNLLRALRIYFCGSESTCPDREPDGSSFSGNSLHPARQRTSKGTRQPGPIRPHGEVRPSGQRHSRLGRTGLYPAP